MLFELIQIALGKRDRLSHILSTDEWSSLFAEAQKQSVVGIAFAGVERINKSESIR